MMRSDSHQITAPQLLAVLRESGAGQVQLAVPRQPVSTLPGAENPIRPLAEQIAELEQQAIRAAMASSSGNKALAAKMLGISRATLYQRLENYV